jgi:hypothetical protein
MNGATRWVRPDQLLVLQQLVDAGRFHPDPLGRFLEPAETLDRLGCRRSRPLSEPRHGHPLLTDLDQQVCRAFE